jgi:photosystem II stability/assembly factor-like uncharacterized protein
VTVVRRLPPSSRLLVVAVTLLCLAAASTSCSKSEDAPAPPGTTIPAAPDLGSDLLWDIAFGANGFTAVGNSGAVVTSPDGVSWKRQPSPTTQTLRAVAIDTDQSVAVGTGGTIVAWKGGAPTPADVRATNLIQPLLGITHGLGMWVAVGAAGTILTSPDLTTWTAQASGVSGDFFGVAFNEKLGEVAAVADDGSIVTSSDGVKWTRGRDVDGTWLWDITVGNGQFAASGAGGTVYTSVDGDQWEKRDTGTTQALRGIAFGNGMFVASGSDNTVVSSTDAVRWTPHQLPDQGVELWRPVFGNNLWAVVGAGTTIETSPDLSTWTGATHTGVAFYGVAATPDITIGVGVGGIVAKREPSGSWTTLTQVAGHRELRSVTWLPPVFIVTGSGGTILTSSDGATFTPHNASTTVAELWSVARGKDNRLVIVGAGGTILSSTDQGSTWKLVDSPSKATLFSVTWGPNGFVAVGVDGAILRSDDGVVWIAENPVTPETLRSVTSDASQYLAVGVAGTILSSADGVAWTRHTTLRTLTLRSVVKTEGAWVAVGAGGLVLRSPDLLTWSIVPSSTTEELFAVATVGSADKITKQLFAVGGVDVSIASTDAGETWQSTKNKA